jgi:hypothetical protein
LTKHKTGSINIKGKAFYRIRLILKGLGKSRAKIRFFLKSKTVLSKSGILKGLCGKT